MHMLVARRALGRPWSRLAASAPASRAVNRTNAYAQDTLVRALRSRANGARGVSSKATLPNILGGGPPPAVVVETLTPAGLRLADGTVIPGACLFIEGEVLLWDAPPMTGGAWVTLDERELRERFEVFELVVPRPEILLLGTGRKLEMPPPSLRKYLNSLGIQVDVMDTWNACSTYNLLAEEGRRVAAALLPHNSQTWEKP